MLKINKGDITTIFMFLFFSLAVLSSQRHFIDDMGRSIDGYFGLSDNGRPFADLILLVASFGNSLADSGIWFQLLSIPVFVSVPFLICKLTDCKINSLLFIPAVVNPFTIESMMYRYDALSMSYSLFSSLLACIILSRGLAFYIPSIALLTSSLSSYQPAMSAFIVLAIFLFIIEEKYKYKQLILRGFVFVLSYLIYSKIISPAFIKGNYTKQYSQLIDFLDFNAFFSNFKSMINFCIENAGFAIISIYCLSFILCISSMLYLLISKKINAFRFFLYILSILLISLTPILILSVLKYPAFAPRIYISLGTSMSCLMAIPFVFLPATKKLCIALSFSLSLVSINMAFVISASNNAQSRYDDAVSNQVLNTIQKIEDDGGKVNSIGFIGYMQPSEISKLSFKKYHMAETLTPLYVKGNWWWGNYMLQLRGIKLKRLNIDEKSFECPYPVNGVFYNYYFSNESLVLDFSKRICR